MNAMATIAYQCTMDNGLLFHVTQPTNRSTERSHCIDHNELMIDLDMNANFFSLWYVM